MSKDQAKDLLEFLKPFGKETAELVLWLREFVWRNFPTANELIYDNYNALAIGWSPTEKAGHSFCNISVMRTNQNIQFGFYWGSEISDTEKLLMGGGTQYRYVVVTNKKHFPKMYIKKLLKEAYMNSVSKVKDPKQFVEAKTIIKSISPSKRRKKSRASKS
jgi:hypothetical protein